MRRVEVVTRRRHIVSWVRPPLRYRLGQVDAPEVADAGLVLGILADADVDAVLVDDRGGDEVVARAAAGQLVLGVLGVAVELPDQLAAAGVERIDPAVAAGEDDLRLARYDGV